MSSVGTIPVTEGASPYHRTPLLVQAWHLGLGKMQRVLFARNTTRIAPAGAALLLAWACALPAAGQSPVDPHVVKITRCAITKPRPFSHHPTGTLIAYVNTGPVILHGITFEVGYRNANGPITRTFDDVGTFAPNEPVSHHFDAFSDVEYAGSATTSCSVTGVR